MKGMKNMETMKKFMLHMALRACPPAIRLEYASEMEEVFFHCVRTETARRRGLSRALIWPRGIWDVLMFAAAVRRDWPEPSPEPVHRSPWSRMNRSLKMRPQDVRAVLRLARKQPFFSGAIVLMLALGLGATHRDLQRGLWRAAQAAAVPGTRSHRAGVGNVARAHIAQLSLTEANFWDMRDWNRSFEELGALHGASFTLTGRRHVAGAVTGATVSVGFFRALAVQPVAGRLFTPGEDDPGAPAERVILSNSLWTAALRRRSGHRRPHASCSTAGRMRSSVCCRPARRGSTSQKSSCRSSAARTPTAAAGNTSASDASNRA